MSWYGTRDSVWTTSEYQNSAVRKLKQPESRREAVCERTFCWLLSSEETIEGVV